jgi:hypothetical protein
MNSILGDAGYWGQQKWSVPMLFGTAVAVRRMIGSDSFGFDRQGLSTAKSMRE